MVVYQLIDPPGPDWAKRGTWFIERSPSGDLRVRFRFSGTREEARDEIDPLNVVVQAEGQ
jgi:hypothetical protein